MATHSSILAWEIPWTEEPGGLQSMGSQRVCYDLVTKTTTNNNDTCSVFKNISNVKPVSLDHQVPSSPPPGQVGLPSLPREGCVQADSGCRQMALAPAPGRGGLGHPAVLQLAWGGGWGTSGKKPLEKRLPSPYHPPPLPLPAQEGRGEGPRDGSMTERLTLAENLFEDTGKKTKHTTEIVGYEGCPPPPLQSA